MKNVMEKRDFWLFMFIAFLILGSVPLMTGLPLIIVLIGVEGVSLIGVFSMFRSLRRKERKRMDLQEVAFAKDQSLSLKLPETDIGRFDAIVSRGKSYLLIAKAKWGIGLVLLLVTISYPFLRSVSFPFPWPSLFGEKVVINLYALPSVFAWIIFGSIILVMWFAARLPKICYKKADFYVMPEGEEGKGRVISKVNTRNGQMIILTTPRKCYSTQNYLLILSKPLRQCEIFDELRPGRILCSGGKSVLPYIKLEEGEIKRDIQAVKKPVVIR